MIFLFVYDLPLQSPSCFILFRSRFWEGDATKRFSVEKGFFSEKGGGNSVNEGFGEEYTGKAIQ